MKYNLKKIMRRAWEIKREDSKNIFSLCLKMAWEEAKEEENDIQLRKQLLLSAEKEYKKIVDRLAQKGKKFPKTIEQRFPWFKFVQDCKDEKFFARIEKRFKDYEEDHYNCFTTCMNLIWEHPAASGVQKFLK